MLLFIVPTKFFKKGNVGCLAFCVPQSTFCLTNPLDSKRRKLLTVNIATAAENAAPVKRQYVKSRPTSCVYKICIPNTD